MLSKSFEIRLMRDRDAKETLALMQALAALSGDELSISSRALKAACLGPKKQFTMLIAVRGQSVVGFCLGRTSRNLYLDIKIRHIDFLFVAERFRRLGLASQLLSAQKDLALKEGAVRFSVDARDHDAAAKKLYKAFGFEKDTQPVSRYRMRL